MVLTNYEIDQCVNTLSALSANPKTPSSKLALCSELLDTLQPLRDDYKNTKGKTLVEKYGTQGGDGKFRVKTKESATNYHAELNTLKAVPITFKDPSKDAADLLNFVNNWQLVTNAGSFDNLL